MTQPAIQDLQRASCQAVKDCPAIEAVLLFGSRARQSHRPDSDWDIAVLVRRDSPDERSERFFAAFDRVNVKVFRPEEIERYCNHPTRIEAAIARQAIPLVGDWTRPRCRTEPLDIGPDEFQGILEEVTDKLGAAIGTLCHESRLFPERACSPMTAEHSWRAMELLAKCVICTYGFVPKSIHHIGGTARQIEELSLDPRNREEARRIAAEVRALDPEGAHDSFTSEGLADTIARLQGTFRFQIRWLRWCLSHRGMPRTQSLSESIGIVANQIASTARRYEEAWPEFVELPEDLQDTVKQWGQDGASIASTGHDALDHDRRQGAGSRAASMKWIMALVFASAVLVAFLYAAFAEVAR